MTASLPEDTVLVGRLCDHDVAAFTLVVDAWSAGMIRLTRSFVTTDDSAQEVVQDTWLAVVSHLGSFAGRSSLQTWVYRILVNTAKRRGEREHRVVPNHSDDRPARPLLRRHRPASPWHTLTGHAAVLEGPSHSEVSDARRQDFQ